MGKWDKNSKNHELQGRETQSYELILKIRRRRVVLWTLSYQNAPTVFPRKKLFFFCSTVLFIDTSQRHDSRNRKYPSYHLTGLKNRCSWVSVQFPFPIIHLKTLQSPQTMKNKSSSSLGSNYIRPILPTVLPWSFQVIRKLPWTSFPMM